MAKQFDKEQTQAIMTTGRNVLVSASAGAGKTGVLVERLTKRAVKDRIRISRIVAMTFTQAAAEEMKKRLAGRLNDEYNASTDPEEKHFLSQQLAGLQSADITTIDSYCLKVIKKYYSTIGLDPRTAQNILDEGTSGIYMRQAFDSVLSQLIEERPEEAKTLLEYFSARSEDTDVVFEAVKSINRTAQAGMDPHGWYEHAIEMYSPVRTLSEINPDILNAFYAGIRYRLESMLSCLKTMKVLSADEKKVKPETLREEEVMITNCLNHLNEGRYESYRSTLADLALHSTSACGPNVEYSSIRKKLNDTKTDLLKTAYPEKILIEDHNDMYPIVRLLVETAEQTWETFSAIKRANACMDFTDMERFAYEILMKNSGSVASIIRDSLDEILVDEFQDTSELQNAIITAISNGHNVFRVGDVKQSIYRFRQAKPELMRSLMDDPDTEQITLRHNYRSKDSIVRFTNLLFSKIMNIEGCRDTYGEADTVSIGENNAYQMEEKLNPVVFAKITDIRKTDPDFDPKRAKADWISSHILHMMKNDPSLRFSDFAVLVRSHADKGIIRSSFESYNIPYDIDGRDGFYQSGTALTVLSLVHVMLDRDDELHLLASLTSPFGGYSDEELAQLKIRHGSVKKGMEKEHPEFFTTVENLRRTAETRDIPAMLTKMACTNGYYDRLTSKDQANFDFLFEKAVNAQFDSLLAFLQVMEAGQDEKSSEAMSRGKDDDAVIATTIHQSKGLQYKIVFLWGTSSNRFNDAGSPVIVNDRLYLGISHNTLPYYAKRPTIERMAVEYATGLEDVEEFVRLLYVAVTRAESRLYLVDCLKEDFEDMDLNVSFLLSRKGITGTMDIPLHDEPVLYRTEEVTDIVHDKAEALPSRYVSKLPVFTANAKPLHRAMTPSSLEPDVLPSLNLQYTDRGKTYGTQIHEIMEKLPDTVWDASMLEGYDLSTSEKKRILAFGNCALYRKALTMTVEKEFPFYISNGDLHMTGSMDFVAHDDHEVIIIDFKTDRASEDQIIMKYRDQLNAYRKAAEIIWPAHTVSVYAYSFHNEKEIKILP